MIYQCTGYCHTLLLTARKTGYRTLFKAFQIDKLQHLAHTLYYLLVGQLFYPQTESNVFIHIKMGKKSISLEHGVDVSLIGRKPVDALTLKENITACRFKKSADYPERSRLAAA